MCKDNLDWDSPLPDSLRLKWERWRTSLSSLESLHVQRCLKPSKLGQIEKAELHHFSDASTSGYGQCSYLRLVTDSEVYCSFLMGKARVAPLKTITVPRLELSAATVSVKVSSLLTKELELENINEIYWTDSKVILGYISNDTKRFHVYVANRVQQIRDHTSPKQWHYVSTDINPADEGSRGMMADEFVKKSKWITGPDFLWEKGAEFLPPEKTDIEIDPTDTEVKRVHTASTNAKKMDYAPILERLERFSSWQMGKSAVAHCLILKAKLRSGLSRNDTRKQSTTKCSLLDVKQLMAAELEIIKQVQKNAFPEEIKILETKMSSTLDSRQVVAERKQGLKKTSTLYRLDPFLDQDGILRVGGRLKHCDDTYDIRHPKILPRKSHITELIIRHFHQGVAHQGRGLTLNKIRSNGFWISGATSAVSNHISKCVNCRRLRASVQQQKMADLPPDRLEPAPPFTYCGVDLFGPWTIREGRKDLKRYGVLFTCLGSRAIHLETVNSLETDALINALRRFLSLRGPIRTLRCDRGTNFVGAENELKRSLEEMEHKQIGQFLLEKNCDYFSFNMNVPSASHMGGIWERQIRSVRNVLQGLMQGFGHRLNDELLRTFMSEAAAIVNSRPLTVENLNYPTSLRPLTPNQLLTLKSDVLLPPPGVFQQTDMYARKRWKTVQFLANQFWTRWKKEFLQNLSIRQKWSAPRCYMEIGDIVLVKDEDLPRNRWSLGRIEEIYPDEEGYVRKVKLVLANRQLCQTFFAPLSLLNDQFIS